MDGGASWIGLAKENGAFKAYLNANSDAPDLSTLLNGAGDLRHALGVDPTNPNRVFFGGGNFIAATDDGGQTFRQATDHRGKWALPYVHTSANAMHFARDGSFYVGSTGGVARSADSGASWDQTLNRGLSTHSIFYICTGGANGMIANTYGTGVRVRVGLTGTFNQELSALGAGCVFNPVNPLEVVWSSDDGLIMKTADGGRSWRKSCQGFPACDSPRQLIDSRLWSSQSSQGLTLYTRSEEQIFKSLNFGNSWQPISPATAGRTYDAFAAAPQNEAILAARIYPGFVVSLDGGQNWSQAGEITGGPTYLQTLEFDPLDSNVLYAASRVVRPEVNHIWRSTDFGQTWKPIDLGGFPTGIHVYDLIADPRRTGTLYAGTYLGVYRSMDRGDTWQRFGQGLPMIRAYDLSLTPDGNTLHVGTGGRGVWEIALVDGGNDDGLQNGVPLKDLAGAKASEQFWTMTVPANASVLRFVTAGGSGDADLYVKFGGKPSTTSYDCRSNRSSNTETCVFPKPQAGTYHVMLRGWGAYAGVSLTGSYSTVARTVYANEADIAIIDRGTVTSAIAVAGRGGNAPADTQVEVDIHHTYRGDLKVELLAPDGTAYLLHDRTGGSADDLRQIYTVDLSSELINGEWKLRVTDLARGDTGQINRWSITL